MRLAGFSTAALVAMVRPLVAAQLDQPALLDRAARAIWSHLVEPGDRTAGRLIALLGPVAALEPLVALRSTRGEDARIVVAWVEALNDALDEAGESDLAPDDDELQQAIDRWRPRFDPRAIERVFSQSARFACRLLVPGDDAWPAGLADLGAHAPIALWTRGDTGRLRALRSSVALVGARAATGYGEQVTIELAAGLADRGYAVVSGGAYGIDGAAHRSTLASNGLTVAVMAGGLDRFYPSGHEALFGRIVERGVMLAEVPCGVSPSKWRFLQRNRLIAALSGATVVVEAGWRSGSLNTAGHAAAIGRPLGAVPGPVTSASSAGCHRLLREYDAVCVTTPAEVAELAPFGGIAVPLDIDGRGGGDTAHAAPPDPSRLRLMDALSVATPRSPLELAAISGLGVDRVRAQLGLLELDGVVAARGAGWVLGR